MAETLPFNRDRAPFRLRPGADAAEVARELVACFEAVAVVPDRVGQSFRAAMQAAGVDRRRPLYRAGEAIARDIDAGIGDGAANPYHNSQHFCEVLLSALCLALLAALPERERAALLVAALAHDFHHDGKTVQGMPYRLERASVEAALPYLKTAGVPEDDRARITALILATEVSQAVAFARACHRHFFDGGERPAVPAAEPRLAPLAADARLALQAVLLTEADVLPSVGLTVAYGELSQANLSREWGRELGPADKLFFLERVFGDFVAARFFSPNLARLKDAMRANARAREN